MLSNGSRVTSEWNPIPHTMSSLYIGGMEDDAPVMPPLCSMSSAKVIRTLVTIVIRDNPHTMTLVCEAELSSAVYYWGKLWVFTIFDDKTLGKP